MGKSYEEVEHTADLALRVHGKDTKELFVNAARAMFAEIGGEPGSPRIEREVQVEGVDYESLLVNWLNELLYLYEANRETWVDFEIVELEPDRLTAIVRGGPTSEAHTLIKAATLHNIAIQERDEGLRVTIVFDV